MTTVLKAVCPRSNETAEFVRNEPLQGFVCTCSMCKDRTNCRSFIADEDLANNPDGGEARRCFCPVYTPNLMRRI